MVRQSLDQRQEALAAAVSHLTNTGDRIVLESQGREVAAVVSLADLALLERLEDRMDLDEARQVLDGLDAEGTVAWEQVKRDLGLD